MTLSTTEPPPAVPEAPHSAASTRRFELIPMAAIRPSPTNPRKRFDAASIAELAASMRDHGLAQPILIRPWTNKAGFYEIVAGERRWRAAKLNEWAAIDTQIRELSDRQVLEIQVIENLQREDIHPLEEAEGYEQLMKSTEYTADQVATKIGKSRSYVYQRLKLLALCSKARKAFFAGDLDATKAVLVARIPHEKLQLEAMEMIGRPDVSYRAAVATVHDRFMLRLVGAPFNTADPLLYPPAGACGPCPKRTGNQPELFGDVQGGDVCTDPACFAVKRANEATRKLEAAKAAGRKVIEGKEAKALFPYESSRHPVGVYERADETEFVAGKPVKLSTLAKKVNVQPILVVRPSTGEVVELFDKPKLLKAAAAAGEIPTPAPRSAVSSDERDRQRKAKLEQEYRRRVLAQVIVGATGRLTSLDWRMVAIWCLRGLAPDTKKRLETFLGWEKGWLTEHYASEKAHALQAHIDALPDGDLAMLIFTTTLIDETYLPSYSTSTAEALHAAAARFDVDVAAIKAAVKKELQPKKITGKRQRVAEAQVDA